MRFLKKNFRNIDEKIDYEILEIPSNKEVDKLPKSHFVDLVAKYGLKPVSDALLAVARDARSNSRYFLANWADKMRDKVSRELKKKDYSEGRYRVDDRLTAEDSDDKVFNDVFRRANDGDASIIDDYSNDDLFLPHRPYKILRDFYGSSIYTRGGINPLGLLADNVDIDDKEACMKIINHRYAEIDSAAETYTSPVDILAKRGCKFVKLAKHPGSENTWGTPLWWLEKGEEMRTERYS